VIYAGVYTQKGDADAALTGVKKDFPKAKVIRVSDDAADRGGGGGENASAGEGAAESVSRDQLNDLQNTSPTEYQRRSQRLPDQTALPGAPPATDNKAPGGGGGGQTIE
jgi:hypothetical protein